jgi:hypothetical protein
MLRRLVFAALLALLVGAPSATADGPQADPGLMLGWTGVTAPGRPFRYVTLPTSSQTVLASVRRSSGRVWNWRTLNGMWGIPRVANDGSVGGLSRDGRLLFVEDWVPPTNGALRTTSRFLLVNTQTFRTWRKIVLRGDFGFDALSPDSGTMFLIQRVSRRDLTSYRVRAYDVHAQRLLPGVIADRTQADWVMHGYPVTRATTSDGRWAYTLYQQPTGGFPFVHALDTVARAAICVGIPWRGNQDLLPSTKLVLDEHAHELTLTTPRGRPLFMLDTKTFQVSRPGHHGAGLFGFLRL